MTTSGASKSLCQDLRIHFIQSGDNGWAKIELKKHFSAFCFLLILFQALIKFSRETVLKLGAVSGNAGKWMIITAEGSLQKILAWKCRELFFISLEELRAWCTRWVDIACMHFALCEYLASACSGDSSVIIVCPSYHLSPMLVWRPVALSRLLAALEDMAQLHPHAWEVYRSTLLWM